MSISDENRKKLAELAGSQKLSKRTQERFDRELRRFNFHFPSLRWWGNTPIEPTGGGVTAAETSLWIRHMLHHISDTMHQFSDDLRDLEDQLNQLNIIINIEVAEALPEVIEHYDLFGLIVTGNNERISEVQNMETSTNKDESVFAYTFRTSYGFIEAVKTKTLIANRKDCTATDAQWIIHSNEIYENNVQNFYTSIEIPSQVNRIWIVNKNSMTDKKDIYFVANNHIRRATFDKETTDATEIIETLNTNYEPYWIINAFKRVPDGKNYIHYMTLDYKVYEYDTTNGDETLLYQIPPKNQDIFDPIYDVIEGKSTIWAVTYKGTTNRYVKEMNGLCFEPCYDAFEFYDTWETPRKIIFSKDFSGINPANMYQEYVNSNELAGDKSLLSAFILTEKNTEYNMSIYQLTPRRFDNSIISDNLNEYFNQNLLNDLIKRDMLADYQGYFSYSFNDIENFKDAPSFLIKDTISSSDGAKFTLENSKFTVEGKIRTFHQTLKLINTDNTNKRVLKVFERDLKQQMTLKGLLMYQYTRWYDNSLPLHSEKINKEVTGNKLDFLSLAGTQRIYKASEFESVFSDTPIDVYKYYDLPLDVNHPLFKEMEKKNVIIETTKGTNYEADSNIYETIIKLTYQDDFAEIQFRRVMRFSSASLGDSFGGRNRASFISPWAYVYYTVRDDTAPPEYEKNPNQGIDQKFKDIINNLQIQINNIKKEIENIYNEINDLKQEIENIYNEIKDIKQEINNINNQLTEINNTLASNNEANKKLFEHFASIGVWKQTGKTILDGEFVPGMGPAGGNIAFYGGMQDGSNFIKTTPVKKDNDVAGGV